MQLRSKKLWFSLLAIAVFVIVAIVLPKLNRQSSSSRDAIESSQESVAALPAISTSVFLNTQAHVKYVGSDACVSCHSHETETFRQTGMGISTSLVDPKNEPPDAEFTDTKSNHRYQVFRKDGQLWHREIDLANESNVNEYPVKYVIGSGINARTYAIEDKGYLAESPMTWYAKPKEWKLSPGYEVSNQGFEREITFGCLFCHAGQAKIVGNSLQRFDIHEAAIGCERCHGPGELHIAARADAADAPKIDHTIVNPPHLDRDRAESICQQCHLHIEATVPIRNRSVVDYRPGLLLNDFRQDYQFENNSGGMNVVGHVEQMHLSRCYTQTETLTCTTCHNPHQFPKPEDRLVYYRNVCIQCHAEAQCKVDPHIRDSQSPENDCVKCHMPTAKTEVQHVAFTHHRIGIHSADESMGHSSGVKLSAWNQNSNLSPLDQELALGLAYAQLARLKPDRAILYNDKAIRILMKVQAAGLKYPTLDAVLARLAFENGRRDAQALADQVLNSSDVRPEDRCVSLFVAAATRLGANKTTEALPHIKELIKLRRNAMDWAMLAEAEKRLGNSEASRNALDEAYRISPAMKQAQAKSPR
jgi:predicted CXXCH cytochrome family protein